MSFRFLTLHPAPSCACCARSLRTGHVELDSWRFRAVTINFAHLWMAPAPRRDQEGDPQAFASSSSDFQAVGEDCALARSRPTTAKGCIGGILTFFPPGLRQNGRRAVLGNMLRLCFGLSRDTA